MTALLVLAGCGSPISNAPFTEEAEFLAVLPDAETWRAPLDVALAPVGDDDVLRAAKASAAAWDGFAEGPVTIGAALRAREPDERTDEARRWRDVEVVARYTGAALGAAEPRRVWVDAEVVRLVDGTFRATVAAGATDGGPRTEVGLGERAGSTTTAAWDLDALFAALGADAAPGPLTVDLVRDEEAGTRTLDGAVGDGPAASGWSVRDDDELSFEAELAITSDGATWPADVAVAVRGGDGGRAEGVLSTGGGETAFTACWDGAGDTVFLGGADGITPVGDRAACPAD